jgi:hypothetical protein
MKFSGTIGGHLDIVCLRLAARLDRDDRIAVSRMRQG